MDLKKLPPSMLLVLGLACDSGNGDSTSDSSTVGPCLSPPAETSAGTSSTNTSGATGMDSTMGPCLGVDPTAAETGATAGTMGTGEVSTGPCLTPEPESTGTDSGSGTEGGSGTTGGMEAPPSESRAQALQRMLDRGALPSDVAARLRSKTKAD